MALSIGWTEIAWRLLLTVIAGSLVGMNRGGRGRPAGLRTTLLVCLAASLSMIQVNLLLTIHGKAADSFVVMDLMRLPLGILSGMGFIGAGAILRKDNLILGVTTAATLWFVTVLGLCIGGGQTELGMAGLGHGLVVLWGLKPIEANWKSDRRGSLEIQFDSQGVTEPQFTSALRDAGFHVSTVAVTYEETSASRELRYRLRWRAKISDAAPPPLIAEWADNPHVTRINWQPET